MKNGLFAVIVSVLCTLSCRKADGPDLPEDSGCIERIVIPVNGHTMSGADVATANALFRNNNIDNSTYRYFRYSHDSVQTYYPPYAKFDQKLVRITEYTNGLPVFTGELLFLFKNDAFSFRSGNPTGGTNLTTTPKLSLGQLRKLFLDNAEEFDHKGTPYGDSCLKTEFGYFNLNAGTGNTAENLIKAWRVALRDTGYSFRYPVAFYQDDDGKLIYYDNGIRTFK